MNKRSIILAACATLVAGRASWAIDTVKTTTSNFTGRVTSIGRLEVKVDKSGVARTIPANEIVMIYYDDEPSVMRTTARTQLLAGRYNDALETLGKVKPEDLESQGASRSPR